MFKALAGIDCMPLCLNVSSPEQFCDVVCALEPTFGGINMEDVAAPHCFRIIAELEKRLSIPIIHDDQFGTATVIIAALLNALKLTGSCTAQASASDQTDPDSTPGNSVGTEDDQASVTVTTTARAWGTPCGSTPTPDGVRDAGEPGLAAVAVNAPWAGPDGTWTASTTLLRRHRRRRPGSGRWPACRRAATRSRSTRRRCRGITVPTFDRDGMGTPNTATAALLAAGHDHRCRLRLRGAGLDRRPDLPRPRPDGAPGPARASPGSRSRPRGSAPTAWPDGGDDLVSTGVTDGSGIYAFTGLPAGQLPGAGRRPRRCRRACSTGSTPTAATTARACRRPRGCDHDQDFGYVTPQVDLSRSPRPTAAPRRRPGSTVVYTLTYANARRPGRRRAWCSPRPCRPTRRSTPALARPAGPASASHVHPRGRRPRRLGGPGDGHLRGHRRLAAAGRGDRRSRTRRPSPTTAPTAPIPTRANNTGTRHHAGDGRP